MWLTHKISPDDTKENNSAMSTFRIPLLTSVVLVIVLLNIARIEVTASECYNNDNCRSRYGDAYKYCIFTTNVTVKKIVLATCVDPARIAVMGNAVTAPTSVVRIASQVWPVESSLL